MPELGASQCVDDSGVLGRQDGEGLDRSSRASSRNLPIAALHVRNAGIGGNRLRGAVRGLARAYETVRRLSGLDHLIVDAKRVRHQPARLHLDLVAAAMGRTPPMTPVTSLKDDPSIDARICGSWASFAANLRR